MYIYIFNHGVFVTLTKLMGHGLTAILFVMIDEYHCYY